MAKNEPRRIVEKVALDIEKLLAKKRKALDVSILSCSNTCLNMCMYLFVFVFVYVFVLFMGGIISYRAKLCKFKHKYVTVL